MVSQQFGDIHLVFNNQDLLTHLTQGQLGHRTTLEKFGASLKHHTNLVEIRQVKGARSAREAPPPKNM
jgi:hypothetical protein